MLHTPSTTLMDLHETVQPIASFENMQIPIAPIVKEKLLILHVLLKYVLLKSMIVEIKHLHVP